MCETQVPVSVPAHDRRQVIAALLIVFGLFGIVSFDLIDDWRRSAGSYSIAHFFWPKHANYWANNAAQLFRWSSMASGIAMLSALVLRHESGFWRRSRTLIILVGSGSPGKV